MVTNTAHKTNSTVVMKEFSGQMPRNVELVIDMDSSGVSLQVYSEDTAGVQAQVTVRYEDGALVLLVHQKECDVRVEPDHRIVLLPAQEQD